METALVLVINDEIHIDISNFSETLINTTRGDFLYPEVQVLISNFNTDLSFIYNLEITKLAVLKNDVEIWHSNKYTNITRLELNVNETDNQYSLVII